MAIGTSDGKYYENEFEHVVDQVGQKYAADIKGQGADMEGPYVGHPLWENLSKERQEEIWNTWGTIHGEASDTVPLNEKDFDKSIGKGSFGVLSNHPKVEDVLKSMPHDDERYDIPFDDKTLHFFVKKTPLVAAAAGQQYAMMDEEARKGKSNVLRPDFTGAGGKGSGGTLPETRESHSTPYSKLGPPAQAHWRKYITDPEVRKNLGIPEGEGADILPFRPK